MARPILPVTLVLGAALWAGAALAQSSVGTAEQQRATGVPSGPMGGTVAPGSGTDAGTTSAPANTATSTTPTGTLTVVPAPAPPPPAAPPASRP